MLGTNITYYKILLGLTYYYEGLVLSHTVLVILLASFYKLLLAVLPSIPNIYKNVYIIYKTYILLNIILYNT